MRGAPGQASNGPDAELGAQLGPPALGHPLGEGLWGQDLALCSPCSAEQTPGGTSEVYHVHAESPPVSCRAGVLLQTSSLHTPTDGQPTTFRAASAHQPPLAQVHEGSQGGTEPLRR